MELSAIGEQVFAVESILKKRLRKVRVEKGGKRKISFFFIFFAMCHRYSTWEPEEHILDRRLVQAFEDKEEKERVVGHRRKGSKSKRVLLNADKWSTDGAAESEQLWRPVMAPGEVTVTDVTLNSLTVTFRESRVAKGFFQDWGLEVWDQVGGEGSERATWDP
uniref:Chromobox 7 n=1 Tax=Cyprinodon variegatus TaxID=28743 RepID=A0A3Q2FDR1_CYPVA